MTILDFLTEDEHGYIHLRGHRIGLYHVLHYYNEEFSAEMLACQYPTLPLALIHKVIAFYLENQAEADAYVACSREELDRQAAAGRHVDLAALRRRLTALQQAEPSHALPK